MSRARTVGVTVAILFVVSLIVAFALGQPASDGSAGQLPAVPKGPASWKAGCGDLKEVNYYPAAGGHTYMWSRFDPTAIDRDFARIRALGANTVRIFIQPTVFGFPTVRPVMADRLSEVIGLAAKHSLRVHLTLFDWWSGYTDIDGSKEWVSSLLSRYRDDPRIAVVELQNEVDPRNREAVAWVTTMLPYLSTVMPGTLRTVSVASVPLEVFALFTHELKNSPPDFWDYHYYGPAGDALLRAEQDQGACGSPSVVRWRNRLQHGRNAGRPSGAGAGTGCLLPGRLRRGRGVGTAHPGAVDPQRLLSGRHPAAEPGSG